jgi:hypothetical protein
MGEAVSSRMPTAPRSSMKVHSAAIRLTTSSAVKELLDLARRYEVGLRELLRFRDLGAAGPAKVMPISKVGRGGWSRR